MRSGIANRPKDQQLYCASDSSTISKLDVFMDVGALMGPTNNNFGKPVYIAL